jgi:hypothetical protein
LGNSRHTLSVGAATSASARLLACLRTSKRGPAEDCAHIFGGSGGMGTTASTNCAAVACHSSEQRLRPVHRPASGVCQDTRRSKRPCATTTLIHLASPDSTFRTRLNPVEPPWYETRMPGGVGGAALKGVLLSRPAAATNTYPKDVRFGSEFARTARRWPDGRRLHMVFGPEHGAAAGQSTRG